MLLVVNYHYVRPEFPSRGIHGETPAQFRDQLERLAKIGTFVSAEAVRRKELPEKAILITFDDGLREQYEHAWPILQEMGIPAIFFVNTQPMVERMVLDVHRIHLLMASLDARDLRVLVARRGDKGTEQAEQKYPYDTIVSAVFKYMVNVEMSRTERVMFLDQALGPQFDAGKVSRELYMDPEIIKQLPDVGTHGYSHENPEREYVRSARTIEAWRGSRPFAASYPFGNRAACDPSLLHPECELAFTMERGINADLSRPLLLGRISCADLPDEGPLDRVWDLPRCAWA